MSTKQIHDLHQENPFPISEAKARCKKYPDLNRRRLERWIRDGLLVKGKGEGDKERVVLEVCRIGGALATSEDALERFFKRVAGEG